MDTAGARQRKLARWLERWRTKVAAAAGIGAALTFWIVYDDYLRAVSLYKISVFIAVAVGGGLALVLAAVSTIVEHKISMAEKAEAFPAARVVAEPPRSPAKPAKPAKTKPASAPATASPPAQVDPPPAGADRPRKPAPPPDPAAGPRILS